MVIAECWKKEHGICEELHIESFDLSNVENDAGMFCYSDIRKIYVDFDKFLPDERSSTVLYESTAEGYYNRDDDFRKITNRTVFEPDFDGSWNY